MFELTSINIEAWLGSLSSDQLNDLVKMVDTLEARGLSDQCIKSYSSFIVQMYRLKDTWPKMNE